MIPATQWRARRLRGFRAFWTDGQSILGAGGYKLYRLNPEGGEEHLGTVPTTFGRRIGAWVRVIRDALRLGIHNA